MVYTSSHADTTLQYDLGSGKEPNIVMISGGKVRMESPSPQGKALMIYDDQTKSFTALHSEEKSYVVMDKSTVQEQGKRMQAMRKQMEAQMQERLKQMPEDQRKKMEEQMARMGIGSSPKAPPSHPEFSTKNTNRTQSINSFSCVVYESYMGSEKIGEACIASPQSLKLSKDDYQTLQGMFAFQRDVQKEFASAAGASTASQQEMEMFDHVDGLPINIKVTNKQGAGMTLASISNQALSPELFQVPPGYHKIDPMQSQGGRGLGGSSQQSAPQGYPQQPPQEGYSAPPSGDQR
jgi:hypothetical protein